MKNIFNKILTAFQTMPVLTDIFWQARRRIFAGTLLILVSRAAGMVFPASAKFFGDEIVVKQNYAYLNRIAFAVALATVVEVSTRFAVSQVLGKAAQEGVAEMRKRIHRKMLGLPISFFNSMAGGQLISRIMNDADGIRILVSTGLGNVTGSFLTMLAAVCVLFYLNWLLTLITLAVLSIFGLSVFASLKKIRPLFRQRSKILGQVYGRLGETINGIRIVKAYVTESKEEREFAVGMREITQNGFESLTASSKISAFSGAATGFIAVLIILIGGNAVQNGSMTFGDFLMYVSFTFLLGAPVAELASLSTQITDALANLDRVREILEIKSEDEGDGHRETFPNAVGTIEFEDVYCRYENDVPVLKGVSFHAASGTTIALVGQSGAGKSTILNLLLRFNQPDRGAIKIDGKDIQKLKLFDYRSHFGVVLQDNFLFDGTVAENVRFSRSNAVAEEIREACVIANAEEFIEKFPDKYETIIGERGVKLSGGQGQRLAIARAILANPRILILDEATSNLDSESESLIQEALFRLREGRTTFIIAHRLSTIRSADQILVMDAGRIIESGSHAELIGLNGKYKTLYDKQFRFETNLFECSSSKTWRKKSRKD